MKKHPIELCLASSSPRRRGLLGRLGVPFFVKPAGPEVEEEIQSAGRGHEAEIVAQERARIKGVAVREQLLAEGRDCSVLSSDTVVHLGPEVLDKPADATQARAFLERLSGTEHGVITALWLWHGGREYQSWTRTWVKFAELTPELMEAYIATGDPFDKAGGYGIQGVGGTLVESIRGCYFNVVGFPLHKTSKLLEEAGISWSLRQEEDSSF